MPGWIVDEPAYYPPSYVERAQQQGEKLRRCLADTDAVVMLQGGQAMLGYYARFPVAFDLFGLTERTIARQRLESRSRPGHEKLPSARFVLYERKVNFLFHFDPALKQLIPAYRHFSIPGVIDGEIYVYDRDLMEQCKLCPGVQFVDFPAWLERDYIPTTAARTERRLRLDWEDFHRFYFDHNTDPELEYRLRAALEASGVRNLTRSPLGNDRGLVAQ